MEMENIHMKKVIIIILTILILGTAAFFIYDFKGNPGGEVTVHIESGMTASRIYDLLKEHKVIASKTAFGLYAKSSAAEYKPGYHPMRRSMGYEAAAEQLKKIVPTVQGEMMVTFPEGLELREFAAVLEEKGLKTADAFISAANAKFDYDFLPPVSDGYLEGYLFPDTYSIAPEMSCEDIINMMLRRFGDIYTQQYRARAQELGMNTHEIITLASIIEREAAAAGERELVSSVFHNRLKSSDYPYLQSCATVQYILSERKAVLSNADIAIDSPYNTYIYKGLPKGPIASPGKASIEAALYPADTDYYFFVSNGDGTQTFSKTFEQHQQSGVNAR